ncbi:MAG: hypothetical protein GXO82_03125 [Chlorobi bacterium]|nr:hypothetical protein [Chlorobiota bacterium]
MRVFSTLLKSIGAICGITLVVIGFLLIISGMQTFSYDPDAPLASFKIIIAAIPLICLPPAVYAIGKTIRMYSKMRRLDVQPESAGKTLFLLSLGVGMSLLILLAVAVLFVLQKTT